MKRKALIFGVTGQDGAILSSILLKKNYKVHGISRTKKKLNLSKLNISNKIKVHNINNLNEKKIIKILSKSFDEIYFLGGQSSVFNSFTAIQETYESQIKPVKFILNFILNQKGRKSKFLYAASSEMFGEKKKREKFNEDTIKDPISPYGLSKLISYEIIKQYRNTYNLPVCSAILFNHESNLRPDEYVLKKITSFILKIKSRKKTKLKIGNINIKRDWGWSEDFMKACNLILKNNKIDDFIIATGKTVSLKTMIKLAFKQYDLNWKSYVEIDKNLFRKFDIKENYADISKIKKVLGWKPKNNYKNIISKI